MAETETRDGVVVAPKLAKRGKPREAKREVTELESTPQTPDELHAWIVANLGVRVARRALVRGDDVAGGDGSGLGEGAAHAAPFSYLCHTYFEGAVQDEGETIGTLGPRPSPLGPSSDCVVWANRGGGKTFLGAIATLLDMVFKAGVQVRIIGGSLQQAERMHEHLRAMFEREGLCELVKGKATRSRIALVNGSCVEVLAASQTAVRGTRVQKVRCDEVDLFDPDVWEAAQLTTRSMKLRGPWGDVVRGSVEALSTMHRPYGLMWDLVLSRGLSARGSQRNGRRGGGGRAGAQRPVFRWGVLDVLERCGDEHVCEREGGESCPLLRECRGRAKGAERQSAGGHVSVSDAIAMQGRVDIATWNAEMLCRRPRRTDSVYPEFDRALHVFSDGSEEQGEREAHTRRSILQPGPVSPRVYVAGMDFGFRAEAVVLLASVERGREGFGAGAWSGDASGGFGGWGGGGIVRIEREHAAKEMTLEEHVRIVQEWIEAGFAGDDGIEWIGVDPAGAQRNDQSGVSNIALLRKAGLSVRSRASRVEDGLNLVRARLSPATMGERGDAMKAQSPQFNAIKPDSRGAGGGAAIGTMPRLLIHERCVRLIECLERYAYPSIGSGLRAAPEPDRLEPSKSEGFDHACDALRYLIVNLDRPGKTRVRRY